MHSRPNDRHWRSPSLALFGFLVLVGSAHAVGEPGAQFLKIPVGPKACAMGEAFVALADDPSAVYWNPAGLTRLPSFHLMGMHMSWLQEMSYQYLSSTLETAHGHFGIALAYSSSGDIPGRDEDFAETGEYSAFDAAVTLSYARRIAEPLSLGAGLKVIRQEIEEESATGFAADVGLLWEDLFIEGLDAGAVVQNVGPEIRFISEGDPLPLTFRAGVAYSIGPVTVTGDGHKPRFSEWRAHAGAEYLLHGLLSLRAGYKTRPETENAVTAGIGIHWDPIRVEYAYVPYSEINSTHAISITFGR